MRRIARIAPFMIRLLFDCRVVREPAYDAPQSARTTQAATTPKWHGSHRKRTSHRIRITRKQNERLRYQCNPRIPSRFSAALEAKITPMGASQCSKAGLDDDERAKQYDV